MIRLLKYLKKYWFFAMLAPIFMILEVLMDFLVARKVGLIIDTVNSFNRLVDDGSMFLKTIVIAGLAMLAFVAIGVVSGVLSGVFANLTSQKFANDLRKALFEKIMHLTFEDTDKFSTSSLITRITNDVTAVQNMVAMSIRMFVRCVSMFIIGIIFTLSISTKFVAILAIALPIEIVIMLIFMLRAFPMFSKIQKKLDKVNSVVHENLTGARVVKAFCKEDYEYDRFVVANNDLTDLILKVNKLLAILMPAFMIIIHLGTVYIYYIGHGSQLEAFKNSIDPSITVGDTQNAATFITMIMSSLIMIGMTFSNIARSAVSASRINEVLKCNVEIEDGTLDITTLTKTGTIEFKNVDFTYPKASAPVLENINFKISQGETIAIVGATGSGKTSLVNLITRFYDVSNGEILVDGVNVKEYKLFDLREKIAMVLQRAELFAGTIAENIMWGKPDATMEEIKEASSIAQCEEYILEKKDQYNEFVEEKGASLSGGQKQRLSIARAIIKKPEIIIFDDATSALDLVTEAKLYKAMREKISNTTKIVVAQRVATAKNADKIIVLDAGTIVAYDTHEKLLENCEVYQDIYNSQLKREDEE